MRHVGSGIIIEVPIPADHRWSSKLRAAEMLCRCPSLTRARRDADAPAQPDILATPVINYLGPYSRLSGATEPMCFRQNVALAVASRLMGEKMAFPA
jgi:hypothetical protein